MFGGPTKNILYKLRGLNGSTNPAYQQADKNRIHKDSGSFFAYELLFQKPWNSSGCPWAT